MDVHDRILFDRDNATGRKVEFESKDGLVIVHAMQDITNHLEENKASYNAVNHKGYKNKLRSKNIWHAASIPNIVCEKWLKEEGINALNDNDWPKVRAKLNSAEYLYLRTSPGKI